MSAPSADRDELDGLPKAIGEALLAHPEWERRDGKVVCAGPRCDWVKPGGKSAQQRWVKHQTWELFAAVKEWYFHE